MKKKRFSPVVLFLAVMLILSPFSVGIGTAKAETEPAAAAGYVSSVPLFAEPQTLRLPRNSTSFWFRVPGGTEFGSQCSLTLVMTASDTLLEGYSTITLFLGNEELATASILDVVNNNAGILAVPIPAERLKADGTLNELKIVTAQRSILGDCADIDNPANWVRLEQTSRLNLDVLQTGDPVLGDTLPYLFDRVDQTNQTSAEFILPSGGDNSARSAMLTLASAVGAAYPAKDTVHFTVSQGTSSAEESNRIFMGLGTQLPLEMAAVPSIAEDQGYLSIARNGNYNDLFFLGGSAAGLEKAGAFFTNSQYLAQLSGTSSVISSELKNVGTGFIMRDDGYYTFADFGYDTVSLAGAFHQQVTYTIKQPQAIKGGADSYVELHFRHATALVADTSLLTVSIDDVAIGSIQLSDSNAAGGSIRVEIPAEALDKDSFFVKVECYNYLGKLDCSKDYYDTAWTLIDKDSTVYFEPGDSGISPTVRQFPVFDADLGNAAPQAILLMPEAASETMVEAATALVCRAGQNSGSAYRWEYANSLDSSKKESADILILGSSDVVIPGEIAELLSVVPREGELLISGTAPVSAEALQNKIVIQAVRSPWNFYRKVYVVTCPVDMEDALKQFVSERNNLNKLDGDLALIDQNNTVTVIHNVSADESAKAPLTAERILGKIVRATGISRGGLIIIAVLLLVIVLLIIRALANRRRFDDAKKKMELTNADAGKTPKKAEDDPDDFDDGTDGR